MGAARTAVAPLRIEYSAIRSWPMSNRSGGTDGRPVSAYIRSKRRDIESSARSAIARIERIG